MRKLWAKAAGGAGQGAGAGPSLSGGAGLKVDLSGRTALVTGGSGELGRAICRTLAACGADVAVHYFQAAASAEKVRAEIEAMGRRCFAVQADVRKREPVERMRDAVAEALGHPDILVNNSVVQYHWKDILKQDEADFRSQFESSVLHNVFMAQLFVPAMIARRRGRIIGINTECAVQCDANQGAYVAGKRGMDGVLRVLAREVGPHQITVNQVAPGWIVSEKRPEDDGASHAAYKARVPLRRRGMEQDVANAVAFLASDLAGFITGAFIPVCGGNVMPAI